MSTTRPDFQEHAYSVPGISSEGATTVYYDPDPVTGCGVTRVTRFPGTSSRPPTPHSSDSAPAVVSHQRFLVGSTRPIGVGLIKSASNPTPIPKSADEDSPNMYYHPMLNEWRPFPTDVECFEERQDEQKHRRLRRIGSKLALKAGGLRRSRTRGKRPIRKEDISLPVPGSKRSAFEPLMRSLL